MRPASGRWTFLELLIEWARQDDDLQAVEALVGALDVVSEPVELASEPQGSTKMHEVNFGASFR